MSKRPLPPEETRFKPGQSGNPGGYAKGVRNRISGKFLHTLAEDFEAHGKDAIERCRVDDPSTYVKVVAGLLPKEVDLGINRLEEMSTDDIIAAVSALRSYLVAGGAAEGTEPPTSSAH
jgi:hypothetical protein